MQYEYINYVLGSYFSSATEESEEQAINAFRSQFQSGDELFENLRSEFARALVDNNCSWVGVFADNEVLEFKNESEAKIYAIKLFEKLLE